MKSSGMSNAHLVQGQMRLFGRRIALVLSWFRYRSAWQQNQVPVISMLKIQAARVAEFPNLWLPTLSPFSRCSALVGLLLPRRSQMLPDRPSRKVFEFLNDNP